jgi:hypothetical protein
VQDKNMFNIIILSKLESSAFELACSVEYNNWTELKKHLEIHFSEFKSVTQLQLELIQHKQRTNIREFATQISLSLGSLNRAIEATEGMQLNQAVRTINEQLALKTFTSNLKANIGMVVRARRPLTLAEAIEVAIEEEEILNTSSGSNKFSNKSNYKFKPLPYSKQNFNFYREKSPENDDHMSENNFNQNYPIKEEYYCAYCNQIGHDIFNCPHPACQASRVNKNFSQSYHDPYNDDHNQFKHNFIFNENSNQSDNNNVYFMEDCGNSSNFNGPIEFENHFSGNESLPFDIETVEEASN